MTSHSNGVNLFLNQHENVPLDRFAETMVRDFYPAIYRLSYSILKDHHDAADAAQDTFITATFKLDQYQVGTNFKAWLYTIAVNTCRSYLRKRKTRQVLIGHISFLQKMADRPKNPEKKAMQKETNSALWSAVENLNEKHRITILLRFMHNLSVNEIAQILEVKEKTIYSRLYSAFRMLKAQLDE